MFDDIVDHSYDLISNQQFWITKFFLWQWWLTMFFSSDLALEMTNWTSFFQSTNEPTLATSATATAIAAPSIQANNSCCY
jgi:hypothetical protein